MGPIKGVYNSGRVEGETTQAATSPRVAEVSALRDALSSRIDALKAYQNVIGREDCKKMMAPLEEALSDLEMIITESKE